MFHSPKFTPLSVSVTVFVEMRSWIENSRTFLSFKGRFCCPRNST